MTHEVQVSGPATRAPPTGAEAVLAAALRRDVEMLAGQIGERNVWRFEALTQAAGHIEQCLSGAMYKVHHHRFEVPPEGRSVANLEAVSPGQAKAQEILIIGAHYDSKPGPGVKLTAIQGVGHGVTEERGQGSGTGGILPDRTLNPEPRTPSDGTPGADDNASGVAAMLALARAFAGRRHARTLRFVAFVNEEPPFFQTPHMGSWVYAKRCRERKDQIIGMLTPETLGYYSDQPHSQRYPFPYKFLYPSTGNFIAFLSNLSSRHLLHRVAGAFRKHSRFPMLAAAVPALIPRIGWSDDWAFWQEGYPALTITDTAFLRYAHYHTPQDTPEKLDYERMASVVAGLEKVVAELVEAE